MATPIFDLSGLDGSNGFRIDGAMGADYLGESVNDAGDVNGDGFDDLIIGAIGADPNGKSSGSSYVVFGKASGFDATLNVSTLNGSNGFRLDGEAEIDFSGNPVSSAGDINGDGFDDVIVSAFRNDANGGDSGSSYIVFGRASGFDAALDLSSLDGSNGFRLNGAAAGNFLGSSVSNVGDINGDGFDDVSIGSNYTDPQTGQTSFVSYTVFGKASGFNAVMEPSSITGSNGFRQDGGVIRDAGDVNGDGFDDFTVGSSVVFGKTGGFSAELDRSNLDGKNGFNVEGEGLSSAGDVNGDGFGDLMTANTSASPNGIPYAGSSYIIFGKASGFDAMLQLSSLDGSNGFRMDGEFAYGQAGKAHSAAGDINGDGFDDVITGAVDASTGYSSNANAYVVFGKASGFNAVVQLGNMDVNTGIRLDNAASGFLGLSVSDAGDINGDGADDLIVGAPGERFPSNGGISYVIFGSRKVSDIIGTPGNDQLLGTAAAEHFKAGAGDDTMIGNGGADIFEGGEGNDAIWVPDLGFDWIFGNAGNDALHLIGSGLELNLTNYASKLNGIEAIDLSGIGDNTLTLTVNDVFNLSDSDTLIVDGDTGDRVIGLSNSWVEEGSDSHYLRYTQLGAVVMVDRAVSSDFSGINLSGLDGTDGFRLDGMAQGDRSGFSVSNAGDVNGDGFDDVIVGALNADPNGFFSGASYVVFGKTSGFDATLNVSTLDGSNGFRLNGVTERDYAGHSVSNAGDVNDDGFDDVIVGGFGADPNGDLSGSSYVVFGRASGFDAALDLSELDGQSGFRLDGEGAQDLSGSSVSNAGDVNGDGFDDVLVSARRLILNDDDPNVIDAMFGSTYVVFGQASGFDAAMNLSGLNGSNGFRLDVKEYNGSVSPQVSTAGDVNGDGFDDVIIGISANGDSKYSYSYVVFGKASGFDATMDLSSLNGGNGFRVEGEGFPKTSNLGSSVSSAGDINGDGFDDVIIGADYGRNDTSFVLFGKASGFDATLNVSSLDGTNGFRLASSEYGYGYPGGSVSNAGDVNGDGFDDLIVGEPKADSKSGMDTGFSYVVFGKASGFNAVMNVSELDGRNGVRLDGAQTYDLSGGSVSGAGDVNGDGFDDLIVGAFAADSNGEDSGSSYVIFGRSDFGGGSQLPTISGTPDDDVLRGTSIAESFEAGDGNDMIIGRGGADVFRGGAGVDQIKVPDLNFASIDGGTGTDILHLDGKDLNLDLASFSGKIQGIETICIYGRGDNTLTLTADSVLALSDTSNALTLHGNAGDLVTVQDDGWVDGGVKGFYHTYTNDEAVLLVGANLAIEFV